MSSENYTSLKNYYVWKTALPEREAAACTSDRFSLRGVRWHFQLSAKYNDIRNENEEQWFFCMVFQKRHYQYWRIQVYVESTSGELELVSSITSDVKALRTCHGKYCIRLMTEDEMFEMRKKKHDYLKDDKITFLITLEDAVKNLYAVKRNDINVTRSEINLLKEMSDDMKNAYSRADDADVEFLCDDRSFPVSRKILAIRSTTFASIFQNPDQSQVNFTDCDSTTFEVFLKYLYTGKVNISCLDIAFSLFVMADRYKEQSLRKECVEYLTECLTADSIPRAIVTADEHRCEELIEAVLDFFEGEPEYLHSEEWYSFEDTYPELAAKVTARIGNQRCDEVV